MKHVILGLLMIQSFSLYDLHKAFQSGISLFYSASFGSLQRALTALVDEELVRADPEPGDPRGKKRHTITDAGRAAWRAGMLAPVEGADAETTMLARVHFLGLLGEEDRLAVIAVLRARAAGDLAELEELATGLDAMAVPAEFADVFAFQRATLDYGIRSHRLALSWLEGLPVR